ncbi:MAG: ABC transporter permease [Clostridiales bacterium]|nr:ABC transporter permease [Candidatus Blautia equi]
MFENIRISFQGIWSHKMRSFLTMLGIIIGIASIIAIVSTIKGTSEQIKEDLIGAGNNTVEIKLKEGDNEYDPEYGMSNAKPPVLSDEMKNDVRNQEHVVNATFYYSRSYSSSVFYQNTGLQGGKVFGIDKNYFDTLGYQVQKGRGFVESDYSDFKKVVVLDSNAAETLMPGENPVGKTLEIGQEPFVIIGVVGKAQDSIRIESLQDFYSAYESVVGTVMIPDRCWPIVFKFDESQNVIIKADATDNMSKAGKAVQDVLNQGLDSSTKFQYRANDTLETVKNMQKLSESTQQQLIWIAGISLLVGGIGVMNIMLVTVTERTKEIGLKKAIGARKKTILGQFLTEAATLTSIGGLIGVGTGIGLSTVVSKVAGTPSAISVPAIVLSVVFSTLIGVVFGLMPSVKAANLNPIDALRSE